MMITKATVACPQCGAKHEETMPLDACVVVYQCRACGATLRPRAGTCCVFCSYGTTPCPPKQREGAA